LPKTRVSGPHGNYLSVSSNMFDAFGYKLASVSANTSAIKTSGPTANPINHTAHFAQNPVDQAQVTVSLKRQDGTTQSHTLKAVDTLSVPAVASEYLIDPNDPATTAANFQTALEGLSGG